MNPSNYEFLGLPGAGKTTVTNQIINDKTGVYDMYTGAKIAFCSQHIPFPVCSVSSKFPSTVFNIIADGIVRYSDISDLNREFIQISNNCVSEYTLNKKRIKTIKKSIRRLSLYRATIDNNLETNKAVIWDEGFLQRALSVFCPPLPQSGISSSLVTQYVTTMPDPDCVFLFDIPIWLSKKRKREKSGGMPFAYRSLDEESLTSTLQRMDHCINLVIEQLREESIQVVTVDASGSVEETYRQVEQEL